MRIRGFTIVLAVILLGVPLTPLSVTAAPPSAKASRDGPGAIGVVGNVAVPDGAAVVRFEASELERRDLSDLEQLILDRASFDLLLASPSMARAVNAFAGHHPVTIVDARPADLGLSRGADLPSFEATHFATTILRVGGVTFEGVHAWDHEPGADIFLTAREWWEETKARHPKDLAVQTESYSSSEWSFRYSTTYTYSTYPYGVLKYRGDWYKSIKETSGHYDIWAVVFDTITDPGRSVWGTSWRTDQTWITSDIEYYRWDHVIIDSEPSTRYDVNWITYQAGFTGYYPGGPSYIYNSYYSGYAVDPIDNSYYWNGDSFFQVSHRIDYNTGPANGAYTSESTVVVQVNQGNCFKIPYQTRAAWRWYSGGTSDQWTESWVDSWREVCP